MGAKLSVKPAHRQFESNTVPMTMQEVLPVLGPLVFSQDKKRGLSSISQMDIYKWTLLNLSRAGPLR